MLRKSETDVEVKTTSVPLRLPLNPDLKSMAVEKYSLIRFGYIGRFKEQKVSNPRSRSLVAKENPSFSRKSRERHLPFAIALLA